MRKIFYGKCSAHRILPTQAPIYIYTPSANQSYNECRPSEIENEIKEYGAKAKPVENTNMKETEKNTT